MNSHLSYLLLTTALSFMLITFTPLVLASPASKTVTPANLQGWSWSGSKDAFVGGPKTPHSGKGSLDFKPNKQAKSPVLTRSDHSGQKMTDITNLSYSTFVKEDGSAPSVQLSFDPDVTDDKNGSYGVMSYSPNLSGSVEKDQWQYWDAVDDQKAHWSLSWSETLASDYPLYRENPCPAELPCTLSQLAAYFPAAGIHKVQGDILFKADNSSAQSSAYLDAVTISDRAQAITYDFEKAKGTSVVQKIKNVFKSIF